ncbi:MAG: DUF47 family protein [Firmicutes bacterium]|nr:DUF47 family protein [Bacillota bacterium]
MPMLFNQKEGDSIFWFFNESLKNVEKGIDILVDVVETRKSLDERLAELVALEAQGDDLTALLKLKLKHKYFQPFDIHDIFYLAEIVDGTLDFVTGIIERIILYGIEKFPDCVRTMVEILRESVKELRVIISLLDRLEQNRQEIAAHCRMVLNLENKCDSIYSQAMANLFEQVANPISVIKYKELYERLEAAVDHCAEICNQVSNLSVKYF